MGVILYVLRLLFLRISALITNLKFINLCYNFFILTKILRNH